MGWPKKQLERERQKRQCPVKVRVAGTGPGPTVNTKGLRALLLFPSPSPALDRGELGQSILEYALVIAVVALVVIGIIWMIGPQLAAVFSSVYESVVIVPTPPSG